MSERWSSKGAEAETLRTLIITNKYYLANNNEPGPASIWKRYPIYQKYKLKNFRSNYTKMLKQIKEEKGVTKKQSKDGLEALNKEIRGKTACSCFSMITTCKL